MRDFLFGACIPLFAKVVNICWTYNGKVCSSPPAVPKWFLIVKVDLGPAFLLAMTMPLTKDGLPLLSGTACINICHWYFNCVATCLECHEEYRRRDTCGHWERSGQTTVHIWEITGFCLWQQEIIIHNQNLPDSALELRRDQMLADCF